MPADETCPNDLCDHKKNLLFKDCPACGKFWWYPNVEKSNQAEERAALEINYTNAVHQSESMDCLSRLTDFETAVTKSFVVVNMKEEELLQFLYDDDREYKNYFLLVEEGLRAPYSFIQADDERGPQKRNYSAATPRK